MGLEPTFDGITTRRLDHFGFIHSCLPRIRTSIKWTKTTCPAIRRGDIICLSDGTRTHIELLHSFLIPNQVGDQLPTHLVIVEQVGIEPTLSDFQSDALINLATIPFAHPQRFEL